MRCDKIHYTSENRKKKRNISAPNINVLNNQFYCHSPKCWWMNQQWQIFQREMFWLTEILPQHHIVYYENIPQTKMELVLLWPDLQQPSKPWNKHKVAMGVKWIKCPTKYKTSVFSKSEQFDVIIITENVIAAKKKPSPKNCYELNCFLRKTWHVECVLFLSIYLLLTSQKKNSLHRIGQFHIISRWHSASNFYFFSFFPFFLFFIFHHKIY